MLYPRTLSQIGTQDFNLSSEKHYRRLLAQSYSLVAPTTLKPMDRPKE